MNQSEEDDEEDSKYEVLPLEEMRRKYYWPDDRPRVVEFDPEKVPIAVRPLIPLAQKWGISDDILRLDTREQASAEEIKDLEQTVKRFEDDLDEWLAGPEASSRPKSPEYVAFSCMRMAAYGC